MDFQSRFSRNAYFTDTSVCDVADDLRFIFFKGGKMWFFIVPSAKTRLCDPHGLSTLYRDYILLIGWKLLPGFPEKPMGLLTIVAHDGTTLAWAMSVLIAHGILPCSAPSRTRTINDHIHQENKNNWTCWLHLTSTCREFETPWIRYVLLVIKWNLKVLAMIPYFKFHFFPHLLIFLQFRDPSYVLNLSTKAVL